MAGSITVSSITLDSDNNFSIKSNTGATLFFANTSGVDIANSIGATAITNDKILSVANTKISGNIISSQIASVSGSVITANTIANSAIQTGAVENYMSAVGLDVPMRNRIINGAMVIDQRNAGASITPGDSQYSVDRWSCRLSQSSKYTVTQDSSANTVAGFTSSLKVTSSSAYTVLTGDYFAVEHNIEGYNTSDLAWGSASAKTVTLSFWVRSSLTGTFGGGIRNGTGSQYTYPFSYTISTANTWEQKTISIAAPTSTWNSNTTNGLGVIVTFGLGVGATYSGTAGAWTSSVNALSATGATSVVGTSGATWYITGVQFEKGSTATPFGFRHYGTELALCQRYFQKYAGFTCVGSSATDVAMSIAYITTMRATPSVSQTGVLTIEDIASADRTQSSTSISLRSNRANATGAAISLGNFSGLTQFRPSIHNVNFNGTDNYITFSAEL